MSFKAWLQRSWGRLREPNKRHLVTTARLLEFDPSVVARMEQCGEDECEVIFVEQVDERHGGTISSRASPAELIETIDSVLTPDERASLMPKRDLPTGSIDEAARLIDVTLSNCHRGLRLLDSFGDSVIVVLVPRRRLASFDEANRHWTL